MRIVLKNKFIILNSFLKRNYNSDNSFNIKGTHYETLGISCYSTDKEIRSKYLELAKILHPVNIII
jgi:DnaJ-class molecular chaperone